MPRERRVHHVETRIANNMTGDELAMELHTLADRIAVHYPTAVVERVSVRPWLIDPKYKRLFFKLTTHEETE